MQSFYKKRNFWRNTAILIGMAPVWVGIIYSTLFDSRAFEIVAFAVMPCILLTLVLVAITGGIFDRIMYGKKISFFVIILLLIIMQIIIAAFLFA